MIHSPPLSRNYLDDVKSDRIYKIFRIHEGALSSELARKQMEPIL